MGTIYTGAIKGAEIDDIAISLIKTWSSSKINTEINAKIDLPETWVNGEIVEFDFNGGLVSSGKTVNDFAPVSHVHSAAQVTVNTNNFGNNLSPTDDNVQKIADAIDDLNISDEFIKLNDTPSSYSGQAGKTVSVNGTEDGLEFSDVGAGDMTKAIYDPTNVSGDAFDRNNHYGVNSPLKTTTIVNPTSGALNAAMIDANDLVVITQNTTSVDQVLGSPTNTSPGKEFTIINESNSTQPISINGLPLQIGEAVTFVWDGMEWSCEPNNLALKSLTGTFIHSGCVISATIGATTFDISSGIAFIVDNYTNPSLPKVTRIDFNGATNIPITNIATSAITYVSIDINGNIVQSITNTWGEADRDNARIGAVSHQNFSTVTSFNNATHGIGWDMVGTFSDITKALGILVENDSDFSYSAGGANMTIGRSSGTAIGLGINRLVRKNPNRITRTADTPVANFLTTWRDGIGGYVLNSINSTITSGLYDDNSTGTTTAPAGIVANNSWTNLRIFYSPDLNLTGVQFGQNTYNSLQNALNGIRTESFDKNPIFNDVLFRGWLTLKGNATNLQDVTQAVFTTASKFGATSSSGVTSAITNQSVYNNSSQPQITTDSTRGAQQIKQGSGADTDKVLEILNGAGSTTFSVDGNGDAIANTFNGVALTTGGSSTAYLSADGTYTTPAGGGGGGLRETIQVAGTQTVNTILYEGAIGAATTLSAGYITLLTAPTGSSFVVTVSKSTDSGATYPTSETVTLTATNKYVKGTLTTAFVEGDFMKIEVTQVGSTVAGQDLTFTVVGS